MKTLITAIMVIILNVMPTSTCTAQEFKKAGDVANLTSFVAISSTVRVGNEVLTLRARQNREMMVISNMSGDTIASIESNLKIEKTRGSKGRLTEQQLNRLNQSFAKLQINTIANFDPRDDLEDLNDRTYIIIMVRTLDNSVFAYVKMLDDLGADKDKVAQFIKTVLQISSELKSDY